MILGLFLEGPFLRFNLKIINFFFLKLFERKYMILGLIFVSKTENSNRVTRFNPNVMYFLSFKKIGEEVHYIGVKSGNSVFIIQKSNWKFMILGLFFKKTTLKS